MDRQRPGSTNERLPVLICSWLDAGQVQRIESAAPERIEVLYEPSLLPAPQYVADHYGAKRTLTSEGLSRWASMLSRAVVSFDFDWEKPAELLERAPNLRWVQSTSSGIGPMLVRLGLAGSPLLVTNAAGIHAQPLAEFVVMAAIYFAKDMPRLSKWKNEHHWQRYCGEQVGGTRMLLVGLGKVGKRIAELSAALGMEVVGCRRSSELLPPPGVSRVISADQIEAHLVNTDFLVLAAPETVETKNLMNRRRLGLLPARAVVINVARGSLLDEAALADMLADGRLRGAALDVVASEPLAADSALWDLPNVIISPHSASTVCPENDRLVDLFIENLHRFLDGHPLINVFDHSQLH